MPYCQQFKQQIEELKQSLSQARDLLGKYVETGEQDEVEEIKTVLSGLKQKEESLRQEFIEKAKELLTEWYKETIKSQRDVQEFVNQLEFTKQGRVKIERMNLNSLGLSSFYLPKIFKDIKELYCYYNHLETLPDLPDGLEKLDCHCNHLKTLPDLPDSLEELDCLNNNLKTLPDLPDGLEVLYCYGNSLKTLPDLPDGLKRLNCENNQLTQETIEKIKSHPNYDPDKFLI